MASLPTRTTLHPLSRASGSALYTSPLPPSSKYTPTTILSSISFPLEIPRRSDELPSKLLLEISLRPARGVGQLRERHVESLVARTLSAVIYMEDFPRQLCQVGLQVLSSEEEEGGQATDYLTLLAASLNAAVLGCLDAAVPMRTVLGAVVVGLSNDSQILLQPDPTQLKTCTSTHVFAFTSSSELVLAESEGGFSIDDWERIESIARRAVLGSKSAADDGEERMDLDGHPETGQIFEGSSIMSIIRKSVEERVMKDERWRGG